MGTDAVLPPAIPDDPTSLDAVIDLWFGAAVRCDTTRVGTVCAFVCSTMSPHLHSVVVRDDVHPTGPHDLGIDDRDPDTAHTGAAHVLADQAHATLRARGFTDAEIRH